MAKSNLSGLLSSVRKIDPFSKSEVLHYYDRPIDKFTHTYKYKPKNNKKYVKKTKITNSSQNIPRIKKPYKPAMTATPFIKKGGGSSGLGSGSKSGKEIDEKMKFNLNMTYGYKGNYEKSTVNFDRLYSVYPSEEIDNICQYVFIVRPNLNILKSQNQLVSYTSSQIKSGYYPTSSPNKDLYFKHLLSEHPMMLRSLCGNKFPGDHDFIPYLVGRTESMQIPDYGIKSYKFTQPYTNFNLPYASHASESYTGGQFEITFREDSEYRIHKLFQAWVYYIDGVTKNKFGPTVANIRNNVFDYATSVYCFTCKADGETLIYWTKYTGCFPTSVPNSDLSFNLRGSPNNKITIPFEYFVQEPMDPYILVDFNKNAHITKNNANSIPYIPVYRSDSLKKIGMTDYRTKTNKSIGMINCETHFIKNTPVSLGSGNGLVGCPFVCRVKGSDGKARYYLRWKKNQITI